MAPRTKSHRAATAILAASMIGGLHATPASAYSIDRWLDERFADPGQARTLGNHIDNAIRHVSGTPVRLRRRWAEV